MASSLSFESLGASFGGVCDDILRFFYRTYFAMRSNSYYVSKSGSDISAFLV